MAHGYENLIPFSERSKEEARENGRRGGEASGRTRRRKANFRKTLNLLLTTEINDEEWKPALEAMGLDPTLETAINAAMIREALKGNVKAFDAIARYAGQSGWSESSDELTKAQTEKVKAETNAVKSKTNAMNIDEGNSDDGFIDSLKESVKTDWKDDEESTSI